MHDIIIDVRGAVVETMRTLFTLLIQMGDSMKHHESDRFYCPDLSHDIESSLCIVILDLISHCSIFSKRSRSVVSFDEASDIRIFISLSSESSVEICDRDESIEP
jgi:hypothetical protein